MQCEKHPAPTFESMEKNNSILKLEIKHQNSEVSPAADREDKGTEKRSSVGNDSSKSPSLSPKVTAFLQSVSGDEASLDQISAEINGERSEKSMKPNRNEDLCETCLICPANTTQLDINGSEDKENDSTTHVLISLENKEEEHKLDQRNEDTTVDNNEGSTEDPDAEILKMAQEEGCVHVEFPGTVTQEGCCRFVSEILKCVLYQRQQLPMTYDQLVYSQKKQQASMQDKDSVRRKPGLAADTEWRKCQQTLRDVEEVLQQLEVLFSLSRVPRVLLLMGGTLVLPVELYEINMEALVMGSGDRSLRVSSCLRQLFRTLFVADLLSDTKPVRLMPTTVLVLAHRDCGVGWFRPKLQFKVPTRVKSHVIALSSDICSCKDLKRDELDWDDYIWFQTPMTIKGFSNRKA